MSAETHTLIPLLDGLDALAAWRASLPAGGVLGFVPTMGALHDGHRSLVERARAECDHVIVSLFVNPTQFEDPADHDLYPRDLNADRVALRGLADAAFTATPEAIYPDGFDAWVEPGPAAARFCGKDRPGHFCGVCTVVARLLRLVSPDRAYFGEKDAQQLFLIREMVGRLELPAEIIGCPLVRDRDGLALSSRNRRLSPSDRALALTLPRALERAFQLWQAGERSPERLRIEMASEFAACGLAADYAEVIVDATFESASNGSPEPWRLLAAVRVGETRLIDNLLLCAGNSLQS